MGGNRVPVCLTRVGRYRSIRAWKFRAEWTLELILYSRKLRCEDKWLTSSSFCIPSHWPRRWKLTLQAVTAIPGRLQMLKQKKLDKFHNLLNVIEQSSLVAIQWRSLFPLLLPWASAYTHTHTRTHFLEISASVISVIQVILRAIGEVGEIRKTPIVPFTGLRMYIWKVTWLNSLLHELKGVMGWELQE